LVFIITLKVFGQKIELKNLMVSDQNSKFIYLGIENKFKLLDTTVHINAAPGIIVHVLHKDTLVLIPRQAGSMILSFATKYGTQEIIFTAKPIPLPAISVGGETSVLMSKTAILENKEIAIQKTDPFFENYKVDSSVVNINGQTFRFKSDKLPGELLMAIEKAKSGDRLEFTYVRAVNPGRGRTISREGKISYELK